MIPKPVLTSGEMVGQLRNAEIETLGRNEIRRKGTEIYSPRMGLFPFRGDGLASEPWLCETPVACGGVSVWSVEAMTGRNGQKRWRVSSTSCVVTAGEPVKRPRDGIV